MQIAHIPGATIGHMSVTHITDSIYTSHSQFKSEDKVTLQTGGSSVADTHSVRTVYYVSIYCVNFKQSCKQQNCNGLWWVKKSKALTDKTIIIIQ